MHEGAFRILRALGDRQRKRRPGLARSAGEAESVVRELLERYPKWFDEDPDGVRATDVGLAALATEFAARRPAALDAAQTDQDATAFGALAEGRAPLRPELDQVWATPASVLARARHLITAGEVQRGLVLLGDDDLTSLALGQLGASRGVHVLDVDSALLGFLSARSTERGFAVGVVVSGDRAERARHAHDITRGQPVGERCDQMPGCGRRPLGVAGGISARCEVPANRPRHNGEGDE